MNINDPIADYLTRVRNDLMRNKKEVVVPHSKIKFNLSKILKGSGFINDFEVVSANNKPQICVKLKYNEDNQSYISELKRVSKPGKRVYCKVDKIPRVKNGLGMAILSTPKGILSDKEAQNARLGGEIICTIW